MNYDVFISYSRKDSAVADEICRCLARNGISYFIDRRDISGGMEFPQELANAISHSSLLLFLASRNSYQSRFTQNEIIFASREKGSGCVIPYVIDDSRLPLFFMMKLKGCNEYRMDEYPIYPGLVDLLRHKLCKAPLSHVADNLDFENVKVQELVRHKDWALHVTFSPDGSRLASCLYDGDIKILDVATGREVFSLEVPAGLTAASSVFSPDGKRLYSAQWNRRGVAYIAAWSMDDGSLIFRKDMPPGDCRHLAITSDGNTLISAYERIAVLDTRDPDKFTEIPFGHSDGALIYEICLADDDLSLIFGGDYLPVTEMSLSTGRVLRTYTEGSVESLAVNSGQTKLATAYQEIISIFDLDKAGAKTRAFRRGDTDFECVALNSDGSLLAAGGKRDELFVWEVRSGKLLFERKIPYAGRILSVCFSGDSHYLAAVTESGKVLLYRFV